MTDPDWRDSAACKDMDTDLFYPPLPADDAPTARAHFDSRPALAICATCPEWVREQCEEHAVANDERGVWGGKTAEMRKAGYKQRLARKREANRANPHRYPPKQCLFCQMTFTPAAWNSLRCGSDDCRTAQVRREREQANARTGGEAMHIPIPCDFCREDFVRSNGSQKFCWRDACCDQFATRYRKLQGKKGPGYVSQTRTA